MFLSPSGYDGEVSSLVEPGSNGLAILPNGSLLLCEHGNRRISRAEGKQRVPLISHFEGKRLNSPNDLLVLDERTLVFTDPPYGLLPLLEEHPERCGRVGRGAGWVGGGGGDTIGAPFTSAVGSWT